MISRDSAPVVGAPAAGGVSKRTFVSGFVALFLISVLLAYGFFLYQLSRDRQTAYAELSAATDLRAHLIGVWLGERHTDARLLSSVQRFGADIEDIARTGRDPTDSALYRFLNAAASVYGHYIFAAVFDSSGVLRMTVGRGAAPIQVPADLVARAIADRSIQVSPLVPGDGPTGPGPQLDFVVPLVKEPELPPTGVAVLRIDAGVFLRPVISEMHVRYASAEANLLRRESDEVIHLAVHRHDEVSSPMRVSVHDSRFASVQVILAPGKPVEALDYRGERVLAVSRAVEGTDWILIGKVDAAEVERGAIRAAAIALAFLLLVAGGGGTVAAMRGKHQRRDYEQRLRLQRLEREVLERHFDYASRFARDIVLLRDASLHVVQCNDAALAAYGYSVEEMRALAPGRLRAPAAQAAFEPDLRASEQTGGKLYRTVHQRKDGGTFPVEVSTRMFVIDGVGFYHSVVRDITEAVEAEQALRDSEARFREMTELSSDWRWAMDAEGRFTSMSERFFERSGLRPEDIIGRRSWEEDACPESRAEAERLAGTIRAHLPFREHEFARQKANGETMWISASGNPVFDEAGRFAGYRGTSTDVTARVLAQRSVRRSEEQLREVLDGIDEIVYHVDAARSDLLLGQVHFVSDRVHAILGYRPQQFVDDRAFWRDRIHPGDLAEVERLTRQMFAVRAPVTREYRAWHSDGRWLWLEDRVAPRMDAAGRVTDLVGVVRDVTERKTAERRIGHLTRLYATLTHVNQAIVRARGEQELFDAICAIAVEQGGMLGSAVRLADQASATLRLVAASSSMKDIARRLVVSFDRASPEFKPLIASPYLENRIEIDNEFTAPEGAPGWLAEVYGTGIRSIAVLPVRRGSEPAGVLAFSSGEAGFFDPDTRALLEEMTVDIGFILETFEYERRRKLAEAALHESEKRFRGLVEQAIAGIFIVEADRFAYVNPRFAELFGYRPEELVGTDPLALVAEESKPVVAESIGGRRTPDLVAGAQFTFLGLRKNGTRFTVGAHGAPATIEGRPAIIGLAQDISEREQAQRRIQAYVHQLESAMLGTVRAVSAMVEMRDPYTAGHERRVAALARAIGAELGLSEETLQCLELAGTVHDVGKISIPAEILVKPTRLTALEYEIIKTHPQLGYDILKDVNFRWPIAQAILQHHERLDGSGYPNGLKGDGINVEARILAVADTVEAMGSHRPYRPTRGIDEALQEIERFRGIRYDAQAVDACLRLFREKGYQLPPH